MASGSVHLRAVVAVGAAWRWRGAGPLLEGSSQAVEVSVLVQGYYLTVYSSGPETKLKPFVVLSWSLSWGMGHVGTEWGAGVLLGQCQIGVRVYCKGRCSCPHLRKARPLCGGIRRYPRAVLSRYLAEGWL